ncbi:DUF5133 domain-containing protein [Streptomyces sp. N35]|uniref:DUF5133 domain-containing protein n=1 Tax=Streptomyces sp. N35 TaxID=2795730 RepID=UPI0018F2E28E|nr:DUF5133 domain-containing protein [Streptomyces sp. N35]
MLVPAARDLRIALAAYADAVIRDERCPTPASARAREDATFTLCVMTGTRDPREAVARTDAWLTGKDVPGGGCEATTAEIGLIGQAVSDGPGTVAPAA